MRNPKSQETRPGDLSFRQKRLPPGAPQNPMDQGPTGSSLTTTEKESINVAGSRGGDEPRIGRLPERAALRLVGICQLRDGFNKSLSMSGEVGSLAGGREFRMSDPDRLTTNDDKTFGLDTRGLILRIIVVAFLAALFWHTVIAARSL
jgi:hypothetical protein